MKHTVAKIQAHSAREGFSLVATIVMLALLMILALGMTSLSTITIRTAGQDAAGIRARANARLALQLAIGELQRLAGPDGRVTAPSSIVAGDKGQAHLTGVWEGWKWDGKGNAPDWKRQKEDRFKGWLVSTNRRDENLKREFAAAAPLGQTIKLVGRSRDIGDEVAAEVVGIENRRGKTRDGIAWAVFDESQKTSLTVPAAEEDKSYGAGFDQLTSASEPGYKAVKAFDWKPLETRRQDRQHLVTINQSRLIGLKKKDVSFHDVTSGSTGLLTNVVDGGLAGDLSRLFAKETLPSAFASRFLYSNEDTPLLPPPTRFTGANPLPSPDPSWALLHSHYRAYDRMGAGNQKEIMVTKQNTFARSDPKAPAMSPQQLLRNPAFNTQQIVPAIAKAQFVFSLTFGVNQTTLNNMWANGSARSSPPSLRDNYITWLVIDPVITLWNPYNVPIRFDELSIQMYRIPMAFRLYKNGVKLSDNFTRLTDAHTVGDFVTRKNHAYLLKLLPPAGQGSMLMQPGEHIVFTGHEWTKHGGHQYSGSGANEGLTMRPGFNPPAGADSSPEIGGVTTQNLFVSKTGVSSGKDYNKTIRTVAVKGGDQIQVEVKPERAGVDDLKEAGGKEVTGFLKYFVGVAEDTRKLVGGIELDYGDKEKDLLPEYDRFALPTIIVNSAIPKTAPNSNASGEDAGADAALRWKEPFLIATFQQKTERDSRWPSRSWVNNAPTNLYSSMGLDEKEGYEHQQYEFKWEPMMDWPPDSPTIEVSNDNNRGYGGSGVYAQTGTEFATFASLPRTPAHSLGQFSHAPLNAGGQLPLTTRPVANSFAPPLVPDDKVLYSSSNRTYLDHSYLANNALFDSWFLSSVADHPQQQGAKARDARSLLKNFFESGKPLPNSRFRPYTGGKSVDTLVEELEDEKEGYKKVAAHLLIDAPFNVNSTSVAAWQALLASNFGGDAPLADGRMDSGDRLPVTRNLPSVGSSFDSASGGSSSDQAKWNGYRRLNQDQIEELAHEIVNQVKKRGPFQSLAEFVNRQPGNGQYSNNGPVEAAIQSAKINETVIDTSLNFAGSTGSNPKAGSGNPADGAPGIITQADLLTPILPQLTARGDTFVIRAYGEATNRDGSKSRAWCEATVQRYPEYVDTSDDPTSLPVSLANQTFGRRFHVTSFRWLKPEEI